MNAEADPLKIFSPELFSGRTALVTGGGRGIGKHIALAFARLGANVVIASRNPENLSPRRRRSPQPVRIVLQYRPISGSPKP